MRNSLKGVDTENYPIRKGGKGRLGRRQEAEASANEEKVVRMEGEREREREKEAKEGWHGPCSVVRA